MKQSISLFMFSFWLMTTQTWAGMVCDRKASPWLDTHCQLPDMQNPDHACRNVQYMKAQSIDPKDPSLIPTYKFPSFTTNFSESFESMSSDLCESYKKSRCSTTANALYKGFSAILVNSLETSKPDVDAFVQSINGRDFDTNLQRNFGIIADKNTEVLRLIDIALTETRKQAELLSSKSSLIQAEENLRIRFTNIRNKIIELSAEEQKMIHLIDRSVENIKLNAELALTRSVGFDCDFDSDFSTEPYNRQLQKFIDTINTTKKEIIDAAQERRSLVHLAYLKVRYFLYKGYADFSNQSFGKVVDDLQKDLWLSRIMLRFTDWWTSATANGIAGRLHTQYYFYSEPLHILKSQKETAVKFKNEITSHPLYQENIGLIAIKAIDDKIAILDSNIFFIESKGWKGLLDLQIASALKRAELLPDDTKCQKAVKLFTDAAAHFDSLSSFDENSSLYKMTVHSCLNQTAGH